MARFTDAGHQALDAWRSAARRRPTPCASGYCRAPSTGRRRRSPGPPRHAEGGLLLPRQQRAGGDDEAAMPSRMRRSKFSLNTHQASNAGEHTFHVQQQRRRRTPACGSGRSSTGRARRRRRRPPPPPSHGRSARAEARPAAPPRPRRASAQQRSRPTSRGRCRDRAIRPASAAQRVSQQALGERRAGAEQRRRQQGIQHPLPGHRRCAHTRGGGLRRRGRPAAPAPPCGSAW